MSKDRIIRAINEKDYITAKELISQEIEKENDNIELLKLSGLCNINSGCTKEAEKDFERLTEINPEDALSFYYLATIYISEENFKKAKTALLKVINLRPDYVDAYKTLAVVNIRLENYTEVLSYAEKMIELAPNDAKIYDILASAALKLNNRETALNYLIRAAELCPESSEYYKKAGSVYFDEGNTEKAIEFFETAIQKNPSDNEILYNLGMVYFFDENYAKAYEYFERAYNADQKPLYLRSLARAALEKGDFSTSVDLYNKLIQIPEENNETNKYFLVCAYDGNNEITKAAPILEKLLSFNLNSVKYKIHLASIYSRLNKKEAAKILYGDIIVSGLVNAGILYEYSVLCAQTGETDKAESMLKKILTMYPDYVNAYKDLAIIYTMRKQFDLAEENFKKALKISPDNISILFEYANYFHLMSDFENAKKLYLKLLKFPNIPVSFKINIGRNYISMNMISRAKTVLLDAFKSEPQNIDLLFLLSQVYFKEGNYENSRQLLEDAYALNPDKEIANMLAKVYEKVGEYDSAYGLLGLIRLSCPQNVGVIIDMAKCKMETKDYAAAKEHLNEVLKIFPESEEASELLKAIEDEENK